MKCSRLLETDYVYIIDNHTESPREVDCTIQKFAECQKANCPAYRLETSPKTKNTFESCTLNAMIRHE